VFGSVSLRQAQRFAFHPCARPTVCVSTIREPSGLRSAHQRMHQFAFDPSGSPAVCDPPIRAPSSLRSAHPGTQQFAIRPSDGSAVCDLPTEGPGGLRFARLRIRQLALPFALRRCPFSAARVPRHVAFIQTLAWILTSGWNATRRFWARVERKPRNPAQTHRLCFEYKPQVLSPRR